MERLWIWKEHTDQGLRARWWLWPLAFAIDLAWHYIDENTNKFLASHSGLFFRTTRTMVMAISPYLLAFLLSLLIIVGLAVHAYFDVRRGRAAANDPVPQDFSSNRVYELERQGSEAIAAARRAEEGAKRVRDGICAATAIVVTYKKLKENPDERDLFRSLSDQTLGFYQHYLTDAQRDPGHTLFQACGKIWNAYSKRETIGELEEQIKIIARSTNSGLDDLV